MKLRMLTAVLCVQSVLVQSQEPDDMHFNEDEARGLFQAARAAYSDGRFAQAQEYFERAYQASGRHELLYNIALSAEQARHDERALDAYRRFLEHFPDSPRARRATIRISELEALANANPEPDPEPDVEPEPDIEPEPEVDPEPAVDPEPVEPEPEPEDSSSNAGAWVLVGGGGAAIVTGLALAIVAAGRASDVEDAPAGTPWIDVSDSYDQSKSFSITGFVLIGVGVAALAGGIGLAIAGGNDDDVAVEVGAGTVAVRGRF